MPIHDFTSQRLYIDAELGAGVRLALPAEQANYLLRVLRMREGDALLVFNGRDGEWQAQIVDATKRGCGLLVGAQTRSQDDGPDIDYLFAPLKRSRLDYMVQKAVEMGVARLQPVLTRRTVAERVNLDRMRANAVEAAEQCGILRVPAVGQPASLEAVISAWPAGRRLVLCDEAAAVGDPLAALQALAGTKVALLVGPEGGFAPQERTRLLALPFVTAISLGPRIMRADTAAVAALALINASIGDWR